MDFSTSLKVACLMSGSTSEPCDLSATEALSLLNSRDISAVELFESCVRRIDSVNPSVNAIVAIDAEAGLARAQLADKRIAASEHSLLCGLPVAIKDLEATRGLTTAYGSMEFKGHVPDASDPIVETIAEAGANIFCKTNVPEFGAGANTVNEVYGATGNPFNPQKTCGGSSGGSAVALATGMVPLATGSDYGGSLRTPASFCGVVGFRPSPGVVPYVHNGVGLNPFVVLGPMGRTVADTHLLLRAQSHSDPRDPYSGSSSVVQDSLPVADLSTIKAVWSTDLGCCEVDHQIAACFEKRVPLFAHAFKTCDNRHPDFGDIHNAFEVLRGVFFVAGNQERLQTYREILGQNVIDNTEYGLDLTPSLIGSAFTQQSVLYHQVLEFFRKTETDVLICPAVSVSAFDHSNRTVTQINDVKMATYMSWLALVYAPTMALCCSCVIPCGVDYKGMPFGIQIVGPKGTDARVLSVAAALEQLFADNAATKRPLPDLEMLST